jgi:hypothetical protein
VCFFFHVHYKAVSLKLAKQGNELPQSNQQRKTKQNNLVGVVLLSVKQNHHTTPPPPHRNDYILSHFQAT